MAPWFSGSLRLDYPQVLILKANVRLTAACQMALTALRVSHPYWWLDIQQLRNLRMFLISVFLTYLSFSSVHCTGMAKASVIHSPQIYASEDCAVMSSSTFVLTDWLSSSPRFEWYSLAS